MYRKTWIFRLHSWYCVRRLVGIHSVNNHHLTAHVSIHHDEGNVQLISINCHKVLQYLFRWRTVCSDKTPRVLSATEPLLADSVSLPWPAMRQVLSIASPLHASHRSRRKPFFFSTVFLPFFSPFLFYTLPPFQVFTPIVLSVVHRFEHGLTSWHVYLRFFLNTSFLPICTYHLL